MPGYALGFSTAANQWIFSMRVIQRISNGFCFPSVERDLFNSILLFYLSVVRKHECKFLKQYQFVFCLFNFPINRIGTRLQSQIKKQTETRTFDEGGRNSRFEAIVYSGL